MAWLGASMAIHLLYLIALIKAFEGAELNAVYPIMRGVAPALAAAVAVFALGDEVNLAIVAGIALVSLGTMAIALWRPPKRSAVGWALLTGATIAAYTVVDAKGARAAPSAASYIVWGFLFLGSGIGTIFAVWRGKAFFVQAKQQWKPGVLAGALSIVSYGAALWSYRLGDVPRLAAPARDLDPVRRGTRRLRAPRESHASPGAQRIDDRRGRRDPARRALAYQILTRFSRCR